MNPGFTPAVITGASSGIGASTARRLAAMGHPVAIGARRVDRLETLASELRDQGATVVASRLDVTDPASVEEFVRTVTAELGGVGVLICNAGHVATGTGYGMDSDSFAREVDVNLLGAQRLVRALVPQMIDAGTGDVVFVSSDTALRARPHAASYSAAKWGLEGLAHALQLELEGTGVRASLIRPGPVATEAGSDWEAEPGREAIEAWARAGVARHAGVLEPDAVADAIGYIVGAPRGVHISALNIDPTAPLISPSAPVSR